MNTCQTCIHWMNVAHATAKSARGLDVTVRQCTAMPPRSDFHWPRTAENHTCGHWNGGEINGGAKPTQHPAGIDKALPPGPLGPITTQPMNAVPIGANTQPMLATCLSSDQLTGLPGLFGQATGKPTDKRTRRK